MSWVDCELGEVLTLKRGYDLPHDQRIEGEVPVVSPSGITGLHNESKAPAPAVVTGRYGTHGASCNANSPINAGFAGLACEHRHSPADCRLRVSL